MRIKLKTAPASEPVTAATVRQLAMPGVPSGFDTQIEAIIPTARQMIENEVNGALITQTWYRWYDWHFPPCLELPWGPLQSVTAITYTDANGDSQTLSTDVYSVDAEAEPSAIHLAYGQTWPVTRCIPKAIRVEYITGFGDDAADVPEALRHAVAVLTAELFNNREASAPVALQAVPWGIKQLVARYKRGRAQ